MTEADLVADVRRLLREGLVHVEPDDVDATPRFYVTLRGRDELQATCDHKFIDSRWCLKCGWTPSEEEIRRIPSESLTIRFITEILDGDDA